jgi:hypothetical protein
MKRTAKRGWLLGFVLVAAVAKSAGASAMPSGEKSAFESPARHIVLVHAEVHRHCHNIATRVYCHKRDRLPINWPPLSDTPSANEAAKLSPRLHWHGNDLVFNCENPRHVRMP